MNRAADHEVRSLAEDLRASHDQTTLSLACMVELSTSLLRAFGERHGIDVRSMLDLQNAIALNWLSARGLSLLEFDAAKRAIRDAGTTANYLDGLPD